MSGEARPVVRIPSIFDSDDDSEEETHSPMTFRALTSTTTTTTTTSTSINTTTTTTAAAATATTAKPVSESLHSKPIPSVPQGSKEPQSLSSNSESDGEPFSPKPEEAKPVKPLDSPDVPSSSEDSENSEDEGGKGFGFSKERKLEDEEVEEEEDVTLVASQEDNINISHSSPENQDGSDDEDDDDSSNSDDDEDESDDDQDRSGSSIEYEGTMLSQEGGSHVVYSPATPLSIKITTIKKGGFAIRQDPPALKPPHQTEGGNKKEHGPEKQEEKLPAVKERGILREPKDKKDSEEDMELEEMKKAEMEVIQKDKPEDTKEEKDEDDMESSESLPGHEKDVGVNEDKEKANSEAEDNENSSSKTIEEKIKLSEEIEDKEREPEDAREVDDMESNEEETLTKDTTRPKMLEHPTPNRNEAEPMEAMVEEDGASNRRPDGTEARDESDGSDVEALEIGSPRPPQPEADQDMKDDENKEEDEPMEVEEEKYLGDEEGLKESSVGDVQKPVEKAGDEKDQKEEEKEEEQAKDMEEEEEMKDMEEEEEIGKPSVDTKTMYSKGEKEEESKESPVNSRATYRKEEEEEEEEVKVAQSDTKTTSRKEEKEENDDTEETTFRRVEKEKEIEESQVVAKTTFRREDKEKEEDKRKEEEEEENEIQETSAVPQTTFRGREKDEENKEKEEGEIQEVPIVAKTTFRGKDTEEEEEEGEIQEVSVVAKTTFEKEKKKEEEEAVQKTLTPSQTTFRKEEKKLKEKYNEEGKEADIPTHSKRQEEKGQETNDAEKQPEVTVEDDVEMKECADEDEEEENRRTDRDSSEVQEVSPPPSTAAPPVTVVLNSDTDSDASMNTEKSREVIPKALIKKKKVPLRVEDVYMDSEDDSHGLSKPPGEAGSENASGYGDGGRFSTMTSETDSVDPEDQRDCLSQHSSSRASSTDLFVKVPSPRPESPSDTPSRSRSIRPKKILTPTSAELARYMEAFKEGWRREIVMRAVQNPTKAGGARADIYYYAPSGKKLRSRVEIEDYLYRSGITDLTLDNFTWVKQPLGVSEKYEQVRHASAKSAGSAVPPTRRKATPGTPTSVGSASPSATQHSSAPLHITQTPKTPPVVTITTFTKTPPMVKIPASIRATSIGKSPIVSSTPSSTKASASPAATAGSKASPSVVYSYDATAPKKRGRGRPRKYSPEEIPPKRARMKTTPIVPIMKKGVSQGDITSPLPPPPPPPPPPAPPTSMSGALPGSPGMQHLQHHTPSSQGMSVGVQRPILPTPTPRPRQPARKTKDPVVTTGHITSLPAGPPKILTPMLVGGARHRTFHCTGTCPLGGGSVPCLQCVKCLCLFHPECTCMPPQIVTIIQTGAAKFLCPNCYRENKENVSSNKWVLPEPFEPLAHDPSSASSETESEDETEERQVWVENYTQVCLRPDTPPTPPSSPSPWPGQSLWRGDGNDSSQEQTSEQSQQSGGPVEASVGVPGIPCLPTNSSMGGQLLQVQQPGSGAPCFFLVQGRPGAPGGEMASMSGSGPMGISKAVPPVILPRLPMDQQQQMPGSFMSQQQQLFRAAVPLQMPPQEFFPPQNQERYIGKHYKQYYERESSFLGELSQRYLLLRHVFKHLSVKDLLVASQVCMLWRDLALSPSLWETVRLRNVCVTDWNEFARFLDQRNTKNLDMRKMRLKEMHITKKGHSTASHTQKQNRKKAQRDNQTQGAPHRKLHSQNSTDDSESSEFQNKQPKDSSESLSKKVKGKEMEVDESKERRVDDGSDSQSSGDLIMESTEEEEETSTHKGKEGQLEDEWQEIFTALSFVRCLRGVTLPSCPSHVLQLLLASCRHLHCINAMDLRHPSGPIRFDPTYLMETPDLTELRIGSATGFSLTTNFNFIKLQKLRVLVMRGLTGDSWPYLGTNLTTLQVGPIKTFASSTWANLGGMTNLQALWLEDGGSLFDSSICDGLSRLTSLRRLCLFNFVVGPKLGSALKKLPNLDRLFVLPVGTEEASIVSQNANMLAAMEVLRHVEELVWAVHTSDVYFSGGCDCIRMPPNDSKMYRGMQENPESNLWSLPKLKTVLKKQLPHSNMRIVKLDPTAASHLARATL